MVYSWLNKLFLLSFGILFIAVPPNADGNSLMAFYRIAQMQDLTLQDASYQRDADVEAQPASVAKLLPQVVGAGTISLQRSSVSNGTGSSASSIACALNEMSRDANCTGTSRTLGLRLTQIILSLQSFAEAKEGRLKTEAAQFTLIAAQQNLILRVAGEYFSLLAANDNLAATRSARDVFGHLLAQAQARDQIGLGARNDVAQAQSFYDATEQRVIDATSQVEDAKLRLKIIADFPTEDIAPLRDEIPLHGPNPPMLTEWIRNASINSPVLRGMRLQAEAARADISVQRGRRWPNISLVGSVSKLSQSETLGGPQSNDYVGLSLEWPMFEGGATNSSIRRSYALYHRAEAELDLMAREVDQRTRSAYRGIEDGVRRVTAANRALSSARVAIEASERNLEYGVGTEFDLLTAQESYFSLERSYKQARYDYLMNSLALKGEAGILTDADIEAVDGLLTLAGTLEHR